MTDPILNAEFEITEGEPLPSLHESYHRMPVIRQLSIALGTLVIVFGTTYLSDISALFLPDDPQEGAAAAIEAPIQSETPPVEDAFDDVDISATAAYVWDVREQRALFNKNADEQLPLASITKLMTALVAYELMDDSAHIDITIDAVRQDGDSGLSDGETFRFQDLTDLMLITSSNDGAYALASAAGASLGETADPAAMFVRAMNARAETIGLSQTYFNNPTGLDVSPETSGAYGSARDVTFLMEYLITHYPGLVELTRSEVANIDDGNGDGHLAENTNKAVAGIDGLIASKTGYTTLAGGNLVVAFDVGLNHPIIVSVLGSTIDGRFDDVMELVDRARHNVLELYN